MAKRKPDPQWNYEKYGDPTDRVCVFCMQDCDSDQLVCCDSYKGIITKEEYAEYYDIEDLEQL